MERLAKQGIRFNQFYAMSVCSPTRISIMTGQNAARHRATNWINPRGNNRGANGPDSWNWPGLKKGDVTLPGVLRTQGYKTIHVGKAHFGPNDHEGSEPLNLGFDINVGGASFVRPVVITRKRNTAKARAAGITPFRISTSTMTRTRSFPRPSPLRLKNTSPRSPE